MEKEKQEIKEALEKLVAVMRKHGCITFGTSVQGVFISTFDYANLRRDSKTNTQSN